MGPMGPIGPTGGFTGPTIGSFGGLMGPMGPIGPTGGFTGPTIGSLGGFTGPIGPIGPTGGLNGPTTGPVGGLMGPMGPIGLVTPPTGRMGTVGAVGDTLPPIGLATFTPPRFETRGLDAWRTLDPPPDRRPPPPEKPPGGAAIAVVQTAPRATEINPATNFRHDRFIAKSFARSDLCCLCWPRAVGRYLAQRKRVPDVTVVAWTFYLLTDFFCSAEKSSKCTCGRDPTTRDMRPMPGTWNSETVAGHP